MKKIRINTLLKKKQNKEKITALTVYDYTFAYLMDEAEIDLLLVGDSLGNVIAGHDTTIPVTMEEMIYHTKAVKRGVKRSLLVADLPFMSYQISKEKAIFNAGRLMKEGGAEAVKIEGTYMNLPTIEHLTKIGIPVMGHLGLTPQSINQFSGFGVRGKEEDEANQIIQAARDLESAGVFAIVLEKIPASLATQITDELTVPTIGIGAGGGCDGQILVSYDMLGLFDKFKPAFLRHYRKLGDEVRSAVKEYCEDVKSGNYPNDDESY
jgi:3-methyl-2-oxobutanoate hydroxymethyltransferase